jgi:acetyl esterase/lipase
MTVVDRGPGTKDTYLFAGQALSSKGFIVVIPDYRLYPEVRYRAFLDDASQAVRWMIDHAPNWAATRTGSISWDIPPAPISRRC